MNGSVPRSCAAALVLVAGASGAGSGAWQFQEVSDQLGAGWSHHLASGHIDSRDFMTGGLAAADIDGDGLVDLYVPRGDVLPGRLLRNLGDGHFADVSQQWGLVVAGGDPPNSYAAGAAFADITGNGHPDLVLGGVRGFGLRLYLNDGGSFTAAGAQWGLAEDLQEHYSVAFADIDGNGWLDLAVAHWNGMPPLGSQGGHLWRNDGAGFTDISDAWGVTPAFEQLDFTFTPNFADFTGNGRPDLVVAADFGTSAVFHNDDGQAFTNATNDQISDENGMGAAVGDFDGDGHLDWFVTSIWDPQQDPGATWGISGNRMYRNDGNGNFIDATDAAGVRDGLWGWGACAADFDIDGDLDLFHVNGFNPVQSPFQNDPSRLFVNDGTGAFTEQAADLGIADTGQGRGVVCFDFDRDGDVDVFIQNNEGSGRAYRNNASENGNHWLGVKLRDLPPNTEAIGARVEVTTGDRVQVREMTIPNHYLSTSPAELLFGLESHATVDSLTVQWPDGTVQVHSDLSVDAWKTFYRPGADGIFSDHFEPSPTRVTPDRALRPARAAAAGPFRPGSRD